MEPTGKPSPLSNILVRAFSFGILIFLARFAYFVTIKGQSCYSGDSCFFSPTVPDTHPIPTPSVARFRDYYSSVFQDLMSDGFLYPESRALCIETLTGSDVVALRDIGVANSFGVTPIPNSTLVVSGRAAKLPFKDKAFDFEFAAAGTLDRSPIPSQFAAEVTRILKPGGFLVVHTTANDEYSLNSLLNLLKSFRIRRSRDVDGLDSPSVREIVLIKDDAAADGKPTIPSLNNCSVPGYKRETIQKTEALIQKEPLKPWITQKRSIKKMRYLPSVVDISFKNRYIYIDVGARSYGSSIGSWFKKHYPKQNKTFQIFAIESDKSFHGSYRAKKKVTLLPYAAWIRNETLFFEISHEPTGANEEKRGRGMASVHAVQSSINFATDSDSVVGLDFADWLKKSFTEKDFVVMKMDVEGTEFHLIPRLIETGAICLVDEMLLECHYNRWRRCCPGQRSQEYQKTYPQCLELLSSLREIGVVVHQLW